MVVGNVDDSAARNQLKKCAICPSRCIIIFRDEIRVYETGGRGKGRVQSGDGAQTTGGLSIIVEEFSCVFP